MITFTNLMVEIPREPNKGKLLGVMLMMMLMMMMIMMMMMLMIMMMMMGITP